MCVNCFCCDSNSTAWVIKYAAQELYVNCQTTGMLCCSEGTAPAFGLQQTGCFYGFATEGCETQGVKEWPAAGRLGPGDSSGFDSACWQCTFHIMSWAARWLSQSCDGEFQWVKSSMSEWFFCLFLESCEIVFPFSTLITYLDDLHSNV